MTVNSVGSASSVQYQGVQARSQSRPPPPPEGTQPFDGGAFIDAIASALKDIGATSASGTATASETSDPARALGDFLHSLAEALHGKGGADAPPPPPPGGAGGPGGPGGGPGGAGGGLQADLQSLIQSLASDDSSTTTDLEQAFSTLVSALGLDASSGTSDKLSEFLQALSTNLQGASASGNLINTTA